MFYVLCTVCCCVAHLGCILDKKWLANAGFYANLILIGYAARIAVEGIVKIIQP